jgi:hypothetical protein
MSADPTAQALLRLTCDQTLLLRGTPNVKAQGNGAASQDV